MNNYNFDNLFNNETKKAHSPITYIDIDKIEPNKNNPYSIEEIDKLSASILELGLMQNLVVKKNKGKFTIISGHRRYTALKDLVKNKKHEEFRNIPCLIVDDQELSELTTIKLHESNLTSRDISNTEKLNAVKELEKAYKALKKNGYKFKDDYSGKLDWLADITKLSKKQVQKYSTINNSEDENVIEEIEKGEITIDEAYDKVKKPKKASSQKNSQKNIIDIVNKLEKVVASLGNETINECIETIKEELENA